MSPHEVAALAAIDALYGADITYTGAGLVAEAVFAVRSDQAAAPYQGFEGRGGQVWFEVDPALLPERPRKTDLIVEPSGARWSVNDIQLDRSINRWVLRVEEAAA